MVRGTFGQNLNSSGVSALQRSRVLGGNGVKGGVALDRGQPAGVFEQEIARFCPLGEQAPDPAFISPDRAAKVEAHG